MANLPEANVSVDDEAGAFGGGAGFAIVLACVALNADLTPRVYSSTKALLGQHGYSQGADYVSQHIDETGQPVVFVGMPIATQGVQTWKDSSGVVGTSRITVSFGASGPLEEVDATFEVTTGGTIGTNGIVGTLSMDGGRTEKTIRLGEAASYVVPYLGITLNFGAGTLVAGDVFKFRTTAPMWDSTGLQDARTALAGQQKLARSWLVIGDLPNSTFGGYVVTQVNAYETAHDRFVFARSGVKDRLPLPIASKDKVTMSGSPTLTFAEVGATGDTVTRSAGSWITDGFAVGHIVTIAGSVSNNVTGRIAALTATVLTFDTTDLVAEGPVSNCTVVGSPNYTFAEVGVSADTVTRSAGSFVTEGFAVGDTVKVTGTASNNVQGVLTAVSATVLTFDTTDLAAEEIASHLVTIEKVQTHAAYVAAQDAAFTSIDGQKRVDISIGRARMLSPITSWEFRRPSFWRLSTREYQHDVHIPCWRKADGPLNNCDMTDGTGRVVEHDERVDGGGLAGRFSCLRTYANGPNGAFGALSLTRATEGSLLSRTHNMAVANLACTVVHAETENAIGQVLVLKSDGRGTTESLSLIEGRVNSALQIALLQDNGEGPRASSAVWRASRDDILNIPGATLNGTLFLLLNGTLEKINTVVRVQTGG